MSTEQEQKLFEKLERLENLLLIRKELLTPNEVAAYMDVNVQHVYDLIGGPKPILKSSCPGGKKRYIAKEDLLVYLKQNESTTADEIESLANKVLLKAK